MPGSGEQREGAFARQARALYAAVACGVAVLDGTGALVYVNPAAEQMPGLSAPEIGWGAVLAGRQVVDQDGQPLDPARYPWAEAVRTGAARRGVMVGLAGEDGGHLWLRVDAVPVEDASGSRYVVVSFVEAAERRRAGAAGDEYLRTLSTHATDLVCVLDGERAVAYASASFRRMLGYEPAELIGRTAWDIVHPEDIPGVRGAFESLGTEHLEIGRLLTVELRVRHRDGSWRVLELLAEDRLGDPAIRGIIVNGRDVTARVETERALSLQALHDTLTGLPNRALLQDRLVAAVAACQRDATQLAVLWVDVDHLKDVNDRLGQHLGDTVLQHLSKRLVDLVRGSDTVARLGGDEFAVLLRVVADDEGAAAAARKIMTALGQPIVAAGQVLDVGVSIGVAVYPDHGSESRTLLQHAEMTMYAAKRAQSGYAVYAREEGPPPIPNRLVLRAELRAAITDEQLVLHYQPRVDLRGGEVHAVEALVRWQHPRRGFIPPSEFVELARQSGLTRQLSLWSLGRALRQARLWQEQGRSLNVAVNLSARDLHDPHLPGQIAELAAREGVPVTRLTVEVTESMVMANPAQVRAVLMALTTQGVRIAVDDFGTGYSSLPGLHQLRVNQINIARSLVRDMAEPGPLHDPVIVRSIIDLGHSLGMAVLAKGVESGPTRALLMTLGCDAAQGFVFSQALPPEALEQWLDEQQRTATATAGENG